MPKYVVLHLVLETAVMPTIYLFSLPFFFFVFVRLVYVRTKPCLSRVLQPTLSAAEKGVCNMWRWMSSLVFFVDLSSERKVVLIAVYMVRVGPTCGRK